MKYFALIVLLLVFSLPCAAQSFVAFGPQISASTSSGFPAGSQTQAGALVMGQFLIPFGPVQFGMGGSMGLFNQPRFFDNGGGMAFEADPEGTMYVPLTAHWSAVVLGGANMQRFSGVTVLNPTAGLGARYLKVDEKGEMQHSIQITYKCLFDDLNNSGNRTFRGYQIGGYMLKKISPHFGLLVGGKVDRQSNSLLTGPRTQPGVYGGIVLF